jgi:hypothetical protein
MTEAFIIEMAPVSLDVLARGEDVYAILGSFCLEKTKSCKMIVGNL